MIISQVEDLVSGAVLHSFLPAAMPVGEQGWQHRNATFTIANIAFGASPWSGGAAPFAPRKWPWQVQVTGLRGYDAAKDALALALGAGYPVRVVAAHDQGYERVCTGVAYTVGAPFSAEATFAYSFNVEWEFNGFWTERNPANVQRRCGEVPLARSGQTTPTALRSGSSFAVAITSATFTVPTTMADASSVGPGGVANQADTGPVITIVGPYGDTTYGFTMTNYSDRYLCSVQYAAPVLAGQILTIDAGAWSATLTQGSATTDVTNNLTVPTTQPYLFAITPGVANDILLTCNGPNPTFGGASSFVLQFHRYFL